MVFSHFLDSLCSERGFPIASVRDLLRPALEKIQLLVSDASQKRQNVSTLRRSVANQHIFQCGTQ